MFSKKEYNANYYRKNLEYFKKYREKNREKLREASKKYYRNNIEYFKKYYKLKKQEQEQNQASNAKV